MWIIPKRISACMPEAADSTWDSSALTQTLSASLSWNTKHQPPRSWSTTLKRVYWMPLLCSRMPTPSRQNDFTDWWTGLLEDRRVNRSVSPESNSAQTMPETSGLSLSDWWNRFSQEAASSRTSLQGNLFGTSTSKSSPDFDIWATKLRQAYSQRLRSARHTTGSESSSSRDWMTPKADDFSGSRPTSNRPLEMSMSLGTQVVQNWPTPKATDDQSDRRSLEAKKRFMERPNASTELAMKAAVWQTPANFQGKYRRQANQTERNEMLLPGQAENWPTPQASDDQRDRQSLEAKKRWMERPNASNELAMKAAMWPTPEASNGTVGEIPKKNVYILPSGRPRAVTNSGQTGSIGLAREVQMWATPTSHNAKGPNNETHNPKDLGREAAMWPSPRSSDEYNDSLSRKPEKQQLREVATQWATPMAADDGRKVTPASHQNSLIKQSANFRQAPQVTGQASPNTSGPRRLNPRFVAWLMNWHPDWLDFHALNGSASQVTE